MDKYLFEDYPLPVGFTFPTSYVEMVSASEYTDLDPWWFLAENKELSVWWADILRNLYPSRSLIPFAKHGGSDDIACFDGTDTSGNPKVYYVHAFASIGWEHRGEAQDFEQWLKEVKAESDEYKADAQESSIVDPEI